MCLMWIRSLFWNGNHVLYGIPWDKIYTLFWLQDADKIRFDESTASFFLPHLCRIVFYRTFRLAELREKTRNCWLTDHMFSHLGPFFLYQMQFFYCGSWIGSGYWNLDPDSGCLEFEEVRRKHEGFFMINLMSGSGSRSAFKEKLRIHAFESRKTDERLLLNV